MTAAEIRQSLDEHDASDGACPLPLWTHALIDAARAHADLLDSDALTNPERVERAGRAIEMHLPLDVQPYAERIAIDAVTAFLADPEPGDQT